LALPTALQADQVGVGWNCFDTVDGTVYDTFSWQGVPLGTFNFGSGLVPVGITDTIIQRLGTVTTPGGTTPISVSALQLRTVSQVNLGAGLGYYYATLDTSAQNTGVLTIDSFPTAGSPGTFHDYFTVNFDIRYGSLAGPIVLRPPSLTLVATGDWSADLPIPSCPIVHTDNQGAGDQHSVTSDTSVPTGGFNPFGVPETSPTLALFGLGTLSLLAYGWCGKKERRMAS
jgi:hypothetical protein